MIFDLMISIILKINYIQNTLIVLIREKVDFLNKFYFRKRKPLTVEKLLMLIKVAEKQVIVESNDMTPGFELK